MPKFIIQLHILTVPSPQNPQVRSFFSILSIFTNLTNYYSDEVAVRLPRDQLYDEEDADGEEYDLIGAGVGR